MLIKKFFTEWIEFGCLRTSVDELFHFIAVFGSFQSSNKIPNVFNSEINSEFSLAHNSSFALSHSTFSSSKSIRSSTTLSNDSYSSSSSCTQNSACFFGPENCAKFDKILSRYKVVLIKCYEKMLRIMQKKQQNTSNDHSDSKTTVLVRPKSLRYEISEKPSCISPTCSASTVF